MQPDGAGWTDGVGRRRRPRPGRRRRAGDHRPGGTALRYEGFDVATAGTAATSLTLVESFRPELIVLDVMLPDLDGFEVAAAARATAGRRVPVALPHRARRDRGQGRAASRSAATTTSRSRSASRSSIARVRADPAPCRRGERRRRARSGSRTSRWTRTRTRSGAADGRIELTPTEFNLLRFLLLNPRRVLSKAQILDHVWHYDFGGDAIDRRDVHQLPAQEGRRRSSRT